MLWELDSTEDNGKCCSSVLIHTTDMDVLIVLFEGQKPSSADYQGFVGSISLGLGSAFTGCRTEVNG
jgi:hypothetical protein